MMAQWVVLIIATLSAAQRMHHWMVTNDDDPGQKAFGFWVIFVLEALWLALLYKCGTFSTIFSHD